eukprot:XP_003242404.2 PREDICTED: uncharacterized protein LOC100570877 [Acyrthosiphon pisum]
MCSIILIDVAPLCRRPTAVRRCAIIPCHPTLIRGINRRPIHRFRHNTFFVQIYSLSFTLFHSKKNQPKPKMGAEKVSMNIVVVGEVQSCKAINKVAKAAPATSHQLMNC